MSRGELVCQQLEQCGIEYVLYLADSEVKDLYPSLEASPRIWMLPVCSEDDAMSIYAGLWLGGKKAALLIQNTGLFAALDALRGVVLYMELPLLLMVGYRGYHDMQAGKKTGDSSSGIWAEPVLDAMKIKHYLLKTEEDAEYIGRAYRESQAANYPVAVLVVGEGIRR